MADDPRQRQLQAAMARLPVLFGGRLCLDFTATIQPCGGRLRFTGEMDGAREFLRGYDDLVAWSHLAGVIDDDRAVQLLATADADPARASAMFARAITLREAIYRVFWAVANGEIPPPPDLVTIQTEHAASVARAVISATDAGFGWQWPEDALEPLAHPIWPIAWSAAELLTAEDVTRVKVCPGVPGDPIPCAGLFYDETKNRSRRWCLMESCGSSVKASRQTARRRDARANPSG